MADLTQELNDLLGVRKAAPVTPTPYSFDRINDFLKEAYQINTRIAELLEFLRSIRRPYLSTAPAPRKSRFAPAPLKHARKASQESKIVEYLSDAQRDSIDTQAKSTWRELNAAVNQLARAEETRQQTERSLILQKRRKKRLGALGRWSAGGVDSEKSKDEEEEDAQAASVSACRDSVIWFLQRGLETCGRTQSEMMEIRISREIEKGRSVLGAVKGPTYSDGVAGSTGLGVAVAEEERKASAAFEEELSMEQQQLFAEENKNMLKLYGDRSAQVRHVEKGLLEISELQSTLVSNLDVQSSHIEQLVTDSFQAAEDVGRGNRELKQATQRRSLARMIFYSSIGLSCFLVGWDLII